MAERYQAVFISPHLDDAVFSCAGEIARLARNGPVLVLNIFTRYLSDVKVRGVVLGDERYQEERDAAAFLGYESRNLGELDVSFRREAYRSLGNIFRAPVVEDMAWLPVLREKLFGELSRIEYDHLYVPLGIGWHVDHVLTYLAFEPWLGRDGVIHYEDLPYCLIPHATRYRMNDLGLPARDDPDLSLAPVGTLRAWWQTAAGYAETAMMKNLKPWIVRQCAVPVVGVYLYRLMSAHRPPASPAVWRWTPRVESLGDNFECKIEAMALYRSQFREFFLDQNDCRASLRHYAGLIHPQCAGLERFWQAVRRS